MRKATVVMLGCLALSVVGARVLGANESDPKEVKAVTDTMQAMVRERADNPTMRPEYVARVILGMPAVLRPARIAA